MAQNVFQFFIEPGLQEVFRDKATGLPLSNGEIFFWKDKARTEPKPVYELTGAPDDPVYVPLPNPLPLTGIGTTSNGFGDDIKVYYNPFNSAGEEELYFIEVYNESGVLQFTREGWPEQIDTGGDANLSFVENFYQDSQFLYHLDVPNNGLLTQETTNLSYGGWVFLLPSGFTSSNTLTFERFPDYVVNPSASPRYSLRFSVVSPNAAETFKDLAWVNNNVNFLADTTVTLQFEAISNNGFPTNIEIFYQKVYGSGGSPTDETFVGTFEIDPTDWAKYTISFTVSNNLGKTIGPNNDDEIRFIVRYPSAIALDISVVDFILTEGQFEVLDHPQVSDYQSKLNALASSIAGPLSDNSNEGDVLTLGGTTSTAVGATGTPLSALVWQPALPVGGIIPYVNAAIPVGFLPCDGSSYNLVGPNATDNFIRLFNIIGTQYGYGEDTFIATSGLPNQTLMTASRVGVAGAPNAHGSGLTLNITITGDGTTAQQVSVDTIAANLIPAGSYFEIEAPSGVSSVYWFQIDGAGVAPTIFPPSALIQMIALTSSDTAQDVADAILANAVTQVQTPDLRGMFLRGWDDGRGLDPDADDRLDPTFTNVVGDVLGSVQYDSVQDHQHNSLVQVSPQMRQDSNDFGPTTGGPTSLINQALPAANPARVSGETRAVNTYVIFIIKT
jgi:hypothetical protein